MTIEQRLSLEQEDRRHEGTLAQLGDRHKFTGCRQCGSKDGMQAVYWKTLGKMSKASSKLFDWHELPGRDEYLFYPCYFCNPDRNIPDGFVPLAVDEVLAWFDDPLAPNYEALAAEPEAMLASLDSRESAGL